MPDKTETPTCWVVTEGLAGTENQCLGVAQALGLEPKVIRVSLAFPWNILSPWLGLECAAAFSPRLAPPWPDLLIASGRKSVAASRYVRRQSAGKTFTVQIQDPRIDPGHFDLVAVPEHDRLRGANVAVTAAAPNRIAAQRLETARREFTELGEMPSPRVAVLIGGNSRTHTMTAQDAGALGKRLSGLNASLMVTASRRTGEENRAIIERELAGKERVYFWDGQGPNPYFALLAWADFILVTADSASMLSEAATTGKPVFYIPMRGGSPKFERLIAGLRARGALRPFEGVLERWSYTPLDDAGALAETIRERLASRRGPLKTCQT